MSKTEVLCRAIASIAVCVTGVMTSSISGKDNTCIGGLVIVIGLTVVWNSSLIGIKS